jgi:hypothetical protein
MLCKNQKCERNCQSRPEAVGRRDGRCRQAGIWELRTDNLGLTAESLPRRRRGTPGDAEVITNLSLRAEYHRSRAGGKRRSRIINPEATGHRLLLLIRPGRKNASGVSPFRLRAFFCGPISCLCGIPAQESRDYPCDRRRACPEPCKGTALTTAGSMSFDVQVR